MKKTKKKKTVKTAAPKTTEQKAPGISKALRDELLIFMEYHPAIRLSRNLRNMVLEFMITDGATEVSYLPDLLYDLSALFELLDNIQEEYVRED